MDPLPYIFPVWQLFKKKILVLLDSLWCILEGKVNILEAYDIQTHLWLNSRLKFIE